jgi:hypothetical protein
MPLRPPKLVRRRRLLVSSAVDVNPPCVTNSVLYSYVLLLDPLYAQCAALTCTAKDLASDERNPISAPTLFIHSLFHVTRFRD